MQDKNVDQKTLWFYLQPGACEFVHLTRVAALNVTVQQRERAAQNLPLQVSFDRIDQSSVPSSSLDAGFTQYADLEEIWNASAQSTLPKA
ncbi:hypothetical protein T265_06052 [Opisthorchis viverrini]|uniref:Uncharacterized protein n=1 Tax=Opisthorchis viverrini TaxID=6198 RepID=A0A075AEJ1_OPIVI|nr:hypothetical protein T265_06052 [Opisthorchis viverrini]KER26769.1 hypothetical protein T265_06052 [Opisthorchis viverrini]